MTHWAQNTTTPRDVSLARPCATMRSYATADEAEAYVASQGSFSPSQKKNTAELFSCEEQATVPPYASGMAFQAHCESIHNARTPCESHVFGNGRAETGWEGLCPKVAGEHGRVPKSEKSVEVIMAGRRLNIRCSNANDEDLMVPLNALGLLERNCRCEARSMGQE